MGWHLTPRGGKQLPSFLSPLISTLSTSSNLCDIWVPLCVSFLRCNHLNPPRNKAAPAEELTIGAFHSHHNLGLGGTYNKASICAPVQADQLAQHCVGSETEYLCAWNRRALQNSPSSWQSLFCFVLFFKAFIHLCRSVWGDKREAPTLNSNVYWLAPASTHCLLSNPRPAPLFSFGRYPIIFSPGAGLRMVSSILIEAKSVITFGHLQWKGISAALAGMRCIMDQWKIPPFNCYSVTH